MKRGVLSLLSAAGVIAVLAVPSAGAGATRAASGPVAPGAPGSESYFDLARMDCVGTARDLSSKVWFTIAGGVLARVLAAR